jgi:membrane-associated PAP2 superfamily phosphatase
MNPHFSLLGVPVTVRPTALVAGTLSALAVALVTRERRVALGTAAGVLWYTADCTHVVGHIVSSQAAGAPMDAVDFGIYPKSVYVDHGVSPQQHIGRAAGGLLASLMAALVLAALARYGANPLARQLLRIAAAQHGLLFAVSLLPVRLVDGGVIYANAAKLRR